jgi:hypothetical protein
VIWPGPRSRRTTPARRLRLPRPRIESDRCLQAPSALRGCGGGRLVEGRPFAFPAGVYRPVRRLLWVVTHTHAQKGSPRHGAQVEARPPQFHHAPSCPGSESELRKPDQRPAVAGGLAPQVLRRRRQLQAASPTPSSTTSFGVGHQATHYSTARVRSSSSSRSSPTTSACPFARPTTSRPSRI